MKETVLISYMHEAIGNIEEKLKFILANSEIEFENPVVPIKQPKMRQLVSLQTSEAMLDAVIKKMGLEYKPIAVAVSEAEPVESETPESGEAQVEEKTSVDESTVQETEPPTEEAEPVVSEDKSE